MQLDHWQLAESPFRTVLDVDHFYPGAAHDEALARLEYLVDAHRRLGVLLGEAGVGKSLTLRVAARRLARKGCAVAAIDTAGLGTRELLWQIAAGLGAAPRDDAEVVQLWRLIADHVTENRLQQTNTVLLVDDAGQAGPDVMTQLVRLARLDPTPAARWTIVLAAEREPSRPLERIAPRLGRPAHRPRALERDRHDRLRAVGPGRRRPLRSGVRR